MSNFRRAPVGGSNRSSILSSLRATEMVGSNDSKPVLPAEIISTILDYLPIPDLMKFARTSKRMQEMVYEDSRWVSRLKSMGVWNEGEARKRFEEVLRKKREMVRIRAEEDNKRIGIGVGVGVGGGGGAANTGTGGMRKTSTTLFDAGEEELRQQRRSAEIALQSARGLADGFETLSISAQGHMSLPPPPRTRTPMQDPEALLNVFAEVKSIRGSARHEYGKIYAALGPFYYDLARSRSHVDPVLFRVYRTPEQQAQMLAHLQVFSQSDWAQGWRQREERLVTMTGIFETAVLREFEQGYEVWDIDGPLETQEKDFFAKVKAVIARVFEPHVDLYLSEELDYFKRLAESEVRDWETKLSAQDASKESFYMGNVNRVADKKDFMSSFKKVVMMPVNVLPTMSPFGATKPVIAPQAGNRSSLQVLSASQSPITSRPTTPSLPPGAISVPLPSEAPTDELAAKAALMASRLEGIRSLFSIEVALDLTHSAKASIERAALFVRLGGQTGEEAREQCEAIFVVLLQILGTRHVKTGFDKAVDHLSKYNPREISEHQQGVVVPLMTFLELVNVGDLISQMIDVFYEQQLATTKLADRNDFLDPAVKAKKKFEQMLDERVAAGLNKGIDVLMDEVEYICGTTQLPTDYNPPDFDANGTNPDIDIGPTTTAEQVVALVESHTKMLTGSTDKTMLDVFNQEVGLRLFAAVCKHLKRQRISTSGAIKLISDMNLYFVYIKTLRNADLLEYFKALRELSQIYLISPGHAKEMATVIADGDRFGGIFRAEEVYEFAERRADWYTVKKDVERAMYGIGCEVM
ncbi:hypothetical protein EYC84_004465 [Monilinia fructicola]|uniref:F-box domain-containing protein n=2 Tax=Monilinia fructicola TaxID=38448 RepID=A0A5M9K0G6_MONFR|nr:hypothetical protein EYC84_004465 [Monilinia fructicola]